MDKSLKPVRGPKKPSFSFSGVGHFQLIHFLEAYHKKCVSIGEEEAALRIEILVDFFKNDFKPEDGLSFNPARLGF
jgi:hypothetical protein